jgi:hypothetical protein
MVIEGWVVAIVGEVEEIDIGSKSFVLIPEVCNTKIKHVSLKEPGL